MPPGKKAASKTPMADYDDGCRVTSISTSSPITTSRRSSSPLISRPANASASRHRSRPSTPNLEKTSKSVSLDPVALHPGIHARCKTIEDPSKAGKIATKPTALEIASDVRPDGTAVAFSGFPVNGLIPYTARANIAGYQAAEISPNQGLQLRILVLDKPAWPGSSGGPVYGVDGRVMGMLLQSGSGLAFARHGARLNEFVSSQ